MSGWEMKILTAEAQRLLAQAADDEDLRAELRALAETILAATAAPATAGEPLRELTLGRRPPSPVKPKPPPDAAADDLALIAARCRAKAAAARQVAEHQRRIHEGADSPSDGEPMDEALATWADRLMDSFYWMNSSDDAPPADVAWLDQVGGGFEAVAAALALVADSRAQRATFERALPLLAEAQSALRRALQQLSAPDDPDQMEVYEWVRTEAARRRLFLRRHMRADDPADPARWPALLDRIAALAAGDRPPPQKAQLDKIRGRQELIREGRGSADDWRALIQAVEELIGAGVPPSNREVRDLLLPIIDDLPDLAPPPHFQLVLREVDRYLASRPPAPTAEAVPEPTPAVKEAARLLAGRSLVLIGGVRRPDAQKVLQAALGLKELVWIATREHQSIRPFEPAIARPDVALILLAIRWSSHAFGDVKHYCDRLGKPLVRLPGGYGPNQVAAQILAQCSTQLGGR